MTIDKFHPTRIDKNDPDYDRVGRSWAGQGEPRKFVFMGIQWMQITDGETAEIVFIPMENEQTIANGYGQSSYEGIIR